MDGTIAAIALSVLSLAISVLTYTAPRTRTQLDDKALEVLKALAEELKK